MNYLRRVLIIGIILVLIVQFTPTNLVLAAPAKDNAAQILERMTPEERIGQLFIVTFSGSTLTGESEILSLITKHHISGVVLRADMDNFVDEPQTLTAAYSLIAELQMAEYESSLQETLEEPGSAGLDQPQYVPLLIAIQQEGDGAPNSEILSGLTPIPSQMAIGATWQPDLSRSVGEVLGEELQAIGVNMLLGPSLDVLEDPRVIGPGDLGTRSFGGDPYWVGQMGMAYIEGIHQGSEGKVGVIAKHFPGMGGGDRPPEEEIATVRKSLSELEQIDLVPFFNVASEAPGIELKIADGFLSSNVRYQGFQGNIRATTRPVSLDREALNALLALEGLNTWREGGGITMSDALGSRAIRRFVESLGEPFKGHLIARDAFLAGNDLLYLHNIQSEGDPDEATTVRTTLSFFAQKYREDPVFAQRVDEAVLRILQFKDRLYVGQFDVESVIPAEVLLGSVGTAEDVTVEVARNAATLISPSQVESEGIIARPPNTDDLLIIFSDSRITRQCSTCTMQMDIPINALKEAILRLYGPFAAGQIAGWNMRSYSMADLANYLGKESEGILEVPLASPEEVEERLHSANWLVFAIQRSSEEEYGSNALKLLMDKRPDLFNEKRTVVFAHDVPYDLDATEISGIDAYYALYAKSSPFIDSAARLLFLEDIAKGSPPVSVPGIGYDLISATSPDPNQIIPITLVNENGPEEGEGEIIYDVGDVVTILTGMIMDANGNAVPDNTPVEFILSYQGENIPSLELSTTTRDGVASVMTALDRPGVIEVRVESPPARQSEIVQLSVQGEALEVSTPGGTSESPTESVEATETSEPSQVPSQAAETQPPDGSSTTSTVEVEDFLVGIIGIGIIATIAFAVANGRSGDRNIQLRIALLAVIGGLIGYNYLALGFPGSADAMESLGLVAGLIFTIIGGGIAMVVGIAWLTQRGQRA